MSSNLEKPQNRTGINPKKRLGQHFLTDLNIAKKIVSALPAPPAEPVVEIGPGTGVLTRLLLEKYADLSLVEFDPEAIEFLKKEFQDSTVRIYHKDFLEWNPADFLAQPAWFIGNLPYNVSSPIFFHLLENLNWIHGGVFMVQKEVAERIASPPGSKDYGILSVLLGAWFDIKIEFKVSEHVFFPKPNVKSAVFSMVKKKNQPEIEFGELKKVVKAAFGQRRKILRNTLSSFGTGRLDEKILALRPEQLSAAEFILLARNLGQHH